MIIKARVKGSPLSPAEHQQRVEAARKRRATKNLLGRHHDWAMYNFRKNGFVGNPTPEQQEALLDDVSSDILNGFRNLEEAREELTGKRPKDFIRYTPAGHETTAKQLQWAIDHEQARIDKIKELDRVRVVSPTGRETGLGSMVLNLSTILKRGKKK